jgi:predicted RNA-binding Zn-ribbon protein involved in translation (DUF1610 family)
MHESITHERVDEDMSDDSMIGYCTACGAEHSPVELDAEGYECESCGELAVNGSLLILLDLGPVDPDSPIY